MDLEWSEYFYCTAPVLLRSKSSNLGKVRKAKLYYLRGVSGKAAKVKEQIMKKDKKVVAGPVVQEG